MIDCIDFLATEKNVNRSDLITQGLRFVSKKYGDELRRHFISNEYSYISGQINDFRSPEYQQYISEFGRKMRRELAERGSANDIPAWFAQAEIGQTFGLSRVRASAKLTYEDFVTLESVFKGGPRRTAKATASFFMFAIEDYTGKLFAMIRRSVSRSSKKEGTSAVQNWFIFESLLKKTADDFEK